MQATSYLLADGRVRELDDDTEEQLCWLWDLSAEEAVSQLYLQHGATDIFTELLANPNLRVVEVAAGVVANMTSHGPVVATMLHNDRYLESVLGLLQLRDAPCLASALRCLHSCGYHLHQEEGDATLTHRWLVFLSLGTIANNLAAVLGGCRNTEVLLQASKLLSILAELWQQSEDTTVSLHYREEQFLACVLEALAESVGQDRTVKHLAVFLSIVYCEAGLGSEVVSSLAERLLQLVELVLQEHVLQYSQLEQSDTALLDCLARLAHLSLATGGWARLPASLQARLAAARARLGQQQPHTGQLLSSCLALLAGLQEDSEESGDSSPTPDSPRHSIPTNSEHNSFRPSPLSSTIKSSLAPSHTNPSPAPSHTSPSPASTHTIPSPVPSNSSASPVPAPSSPRAAC